MGTQAVPKKRNWWVLGAFGGGGEAVSSGKKAKLHSVQLKRLSCTQCNLVRIPTIAPLVGWSIAVLDGLTTDSSTACMRLNCILAR